MKTTTSFTFKFLIGEINYSFTVPAPTEASAKAKLLDNLEKIAIEIEASLPKGV